MNPWPWRRMSLAERLWEHVETEPNSGCWFWIGEYTPRGRGLIRIKGKGYVAARVSYEAFVGPLAEGVWALHICDNGRCINPAHLYPGTHAENMRDMVTRGRAAAGVRHWTRLYPSRMKITAAQVAEIRVRSTTEKHADLAAEFGVSRSYVVKIRRGERCHPVG